LTISTKADGTESRDSGKRQCGCYCLSAVASIFVAPARTYGDHRCPAYDRPARVGQNEIGGVPGRHERSTDPCQLNALLCHSRHICGHKMRRVWGWRHLMACAFPVRWSAPGWRARCPLFTGNYKSFCECHNGLQEYVLTSTFPGKNNCNKLRLPLAMLSPALGWLGYSELIQYRWPVGRPTSGKMWPRCPPRFPARSLLSAQLRKYCRHETRP